MSNSSGPIFLLILLLIFSYLAFYSFEIPTILYGNTTTILAKITATDILPASGGHGYTQNITYVFTKDGKSYFGVKRIDRKNAHQQIGNRILIEYEDNNLNKVSIKRFFDDYNTKNESSFLSNKKNGYYQISIINDIFFFHEYANYGVIINTIMGESSIKKDTLIVKPFIKKNEPNNLNSLKYLITTDSSDRKKLIDLGSKLIYE